MTREEAREALSVLKIYDAQWLREAVDMAIEALQAEYEDYEHATLVDIKEPLKVEVVRCKDCRHHDPEDKKCDCGHDIRWQSPRQDDWFCADGERREP